MFGLANKLCEQSVVEKCARHLERIETTKNLNAFICVLKDYALNKAKESDKRIALGNARILEGVTIAVKDNFCIADCKTTCASRMLENFQPPYDATVVKKLKDAGAIILGKTNLDEFAMGSGTVDSIFGPTKNIWGSALENNWNAQSDDREKWRISGGSSGGSAIAVATGSCYAAIGSDTGGSTRNPASYCGVVGFKPSYGVVSRHGLIPLVNSMDVPGILGRKVENVWKIFDVIRGMDPLDSTTIEENMKNDWEFSADKIHIGVPMEYLTDSVSEDVKETVKYVADLFDSKGAKVEEISMPHTELSIGTYSILNQCEVASNMCRFSGLLFGHRSTRGTNSTDQIIAQSRREAFGNVVKSRILAGNYFLLQKNYEKYFVQAMKVRRLIANDFANVWAGGVDFLLTPTTNSTAPAFDDFVKLDNRTQCSTQDFCTQPSNMAGCCAISVPIRLSSTGLPIGVQMMAGNYADFYLLTVAQWLQQQCCFPHLS